MKWELTKYEEEMDSKNETEHVPPKILNIISFNLENKFIND